MFKIGKILKNKKAVSPVISVLLMVSIAVVAALITYTWVTGFVGTTTVKAGHAIQIQAVKYWINTTGDTCINITVQNVGDGDLEMVSSVFINGTKYDVTWKDVKGNPLTNNILAEGKIAIASVKVGWAGGNEHVIRVVCKDGTFTEGKFVAPT